MDAGSMEVDQGRVWSAMDSVVKVICVHAKPNFALPWQRKNQEVSCSSGFVIDKRRVLTNAHSVEFYTQVKLMKRGSDTKYLATVLAIGTECDIAMLTVADEEFWEGTSPVKFGHFPTLQDTVTVVGYPLYRDTICVTRGIVSRIEVVHYNHGQTKLLGLQIDAAVNAGNSGGPTLNAKEECVGIAFQSDNQAGLNDISYVIPVPVILHFIKDIERNGQYTGFPVLGLKWQKMENPHLRSVMGMGPSVSGVRVRSTSPDLMFLKQTDVMLRIDGVQIGNDGTYPFQQGRLHFSNLISEKHFGDEVRITVMRDKVVHEFNVTLNRPRFLVPTRHSEPLSYYVIAGFVFVAVSAPYLRHECGNLCVNPMLLAESLDDQLVAVSQVLAADINIGYEDIAGSQVYYFNTKPVKNLKSLVTMIESCDEEFLIFETRDMVVALRTKAAKEATPNILATYCVPSVMSDDLKSSVMSI